MDDITDMSMCNLVNERYSVGQVQVSGLFLNETMSVVRCDDLSWYVAFLLII